MTTVEGIAEAVNDSGVRIDGAWHNRSKFRPVDLPSPGARIRLQVDGKGFISSLERLDEATSVPNDRSREIQRMAAMKTAAQLVGAFAQTHEEVRVDHVFPLADKILQWLEQ